MQWKFRHLSARKLQGDSTQAHSQNFSWGGGGGGGGGVGGVPQKLEPIN